MSKQRMRALVHGLREIPEQQVVVLVHEARYLVQHLDTNTVRTYTMKTDG